jgi:hypothetical protein
MFFSAELILFGWALAILMSLAAGCVISTIASDNAARDQQLSSDTASNGAPADSSSQHREVERLPKGSVLLLSSIATFSLWFVKMRIMNFIPNSYLPNDPALIAFFVSAVEVGLVVLVWQRVVLRRQRTRP